MRLRRSTIPGYERFLGVTGVEPAVRTPTGWEGMVVSATGDRVVRLGTQYGTVEVALPEAYVDWFRAQLSWQVAPPRH